MAVVCLAAAGLAAAEHRGVVKFGNLPLPGATVTATQGDKKVTAVTDAQGAYTFPDLAEGVWNLQVEMLCFTTVEREVAVAAGGPAAEWEMKLLPLEQIKAQAAAPAPAAPTAASAAPAPAAAAAAEATPSLKAAQEQVAAASKNTKGKAKNKTATAANGQNNGFQHADVNASSGAAATGDSGAAGGAAANGMAADANQSAADAMVVNGSSSNGIERRAFGNARRGAGSMFRAELMTAESNSALNARSFSMTGQDTAKPSYNNATFGGSFGGPLWIPHVLRANGQFFLSYQGTRNRTASISSSLMPTALERSGDFSQALTSSGSTATVYDPSSGAPFPNDAIPQSRISPQAAKLLKLYPQPNFSLNSRYNYQVPLVGRSDSDAMQARVNRSLNSKNYVNGMFAYQNSRSTNVNAFGFVDSSDSSGMNSNATWRRIFNRQNTAVLTGSFSRYASNTTPNFAYRENISGEAGITGNDQTPENWGPPSLSFSSGLSGLSDANDSHTRNQTAAVNAQWLWFRRPHNVTVGVDFRRQQMNTIAQQNARGSFGFTGAASEQTLNGSAVYGTGFDFADFLLGVPDTSAIAYGNADKYLRASVWDAFIADDFRVSSTLTVNAGLRWDYSSPITEKYGRLVNLDISPGFTSSTPVIGSSPTGGVTHNAYPSSLVHPDKHLVQPRIGIAWHPLLGSSLVIRAGYGMNVNTSPYSGIADQMTQQSPLSKSLQVSNSASNPLTLANGFVGSTTTTANTFAVDPNFLVGYVQTWSLSAQRDLPGSLVGTVTYLGNKGTRGLQVFLPNTYPMGATNPCSTCLPGYKYLASGGDSTRESGSVQLRRRFHNGFASTMQYTYSKSIDDAGLGGRGTAGLIAQNWLNLRAERALSSFDQRHNVQVQAQYTTGVGVHGGTLLSGWRGAVYKGWTITTSLTTGTGLPQTPIYGYAVPGTGLTGTMRPLYTGQPLYDAPAGRYLNPSAYSAPLSGQWGNAGRNTITGPGQFSFDASMARSFSSKLDLSLATSNALNHPVYASYVTAITNSQFGLPASVNAMRSVRLTLRWRF